MNKSDRSVIFSFCLEKRLDVGEVLFDYDDFGESLFFLTEGRLAVHKYTGFQDKMQVVALLDGGTVVGEAALLTDHCHKTKVTAIEDSILYGLTREKFHLLQEEYPVIASRFLEYLLSVASLRLEKTTERLAHIL